MNAARANFKNANSILIVGLGNPGNDYQYTRHNIGFMAVDSIASHYNFPSFSTNSKFSAEITQATINGLKVYLAKPTTYMNLSGQAVQKIKSFYKIETSHIIVIHDDIDLEFGKIKVKIGGGHGGHNGLRSIDSHLGKDYFRMRLGVGRPQHKDDVANYVLNNFSKAEMPEVISLNERIAANLPLLFTDSPDKFLQNL
ncbi:MAG: pth [Rickettsiaceae bacterium]|jgi:PTH1 family peptidyl-tRNA hydrolase|nr:pth [Rickettsiaceae bacterium]